MRWPGSVAAAGLALLALAGFSCGREGPPLSPAEVIATRADVLPVEPADSVWAGAPVHAAPLILQDLVEPRLMEASTAEVRVQALTDGVRLAFRLEWDDPAADDLPGVGRFSDACAVQLPAETRADVPAPQMGETGRPVEIVLWRAFWQSSADGREDTIKALYPNAAVDHYPFQSPSLPPGSTEQQSMEERYAPARALGNRMEGPRDRPVEDLLAEGPGTLKRAAEQPSQGRGQRTASGWAVVLSRPLPAGLGPGGRSQVALAVWEGGRGEGGSRKMRTGWIPLTIEGKEGA